MDLKDMSSNRTVGTYYMKRQQQQQQENKTD